MRIGSILTAAWGFYTASPMMWAVLAAGRVDKKASEDLRIAAYARLVEGAVGLGRAERGRTEGGVVE